MAASKATPYAGAKNWRDTQIEIDRLLEKHGIENMQWTISSERKLAMLTFEKKLYVYTPCTNLKNCSGCGRCCEYKRPAGRTRYAYVPLNGGDRVGFLRETRGKVNVRLNLPLPTDEKKRNSAFRFFLYYLKSKLEAVAFRLDDGTELLEFEREFFGHVLVTDSRTGQASTAYDLVDSGALRLADSTDRGVIALPGGRDNDVIDAEFS